MLQVIRFTIQKPNLAKNADECLDFVIANLNPDVYVLHSWDLLEAIYTRAKARGLRVEFYRPEREGVPAKVWTMDELEIVFRDHIEFR